MNSETPPKLIALVGGYALYLATLSRRLKDDE